MKKVVLFFVTLIMCAMSGFCADPPSGWDLMYMFSGKAEYCATILNHGNDEIYISLNKDEISISFSTGKKLRGPVTMNFGGISCNGKKSDYSDDWDFTLPVNQKLNAALNTIAAGNTNITIKHAGGTITIPFNNAAAKNIVKAMKWQKSNPIGL